MKCNSDRHSTFLHLDFCCSAKAPCHLPSTSQPQSSELKSAPATNKMSSSTSVFEQRIFRYAEFTKGETLNQPRPILPSHFTTRPALTATKMCRVKLLSLLILIANVSGENFGELSCSKDGLDCSVGLIDPALNSLDQEDPKLVEEIKKRLGPIPPPGKILATVFGEFEQVMLTSSKQHLCFSEPHTQEFSRKNENV